MIRIEFKKTGHNIFEKDGNKLGLKKKRYIIKDLSRLHGSGVILHISNKFLKMKNYLEKNNIDRWNIWGIDGDGELNSYVLTIHEAVKMILASYEDGEYTEYYLFPDIPKD